MYNTALLIYIVRSKLGIWMSYLFHLFIMYMSNKITNKCKVLG
jgi:hypothetical protein